VLAPPSLPPRAPGSTRPGLLSFRPSGVIARRRSPVQLTETRGKNTCKQGSQARVRASSAGFRTLKRLTDLHPPGVRALAKHSAGDRKPLPLRPRRRYAGPPSRQSLAKKIDAHAGRP
jgi:hypothetical protein